MSSLGISEESECFWGGRFFLLNQGLWILGLIGGDCSENMVILEKLVSGALDGIVGGLLGFPS